ncbi:DUF4283 domain protein [Medicago truncatula]|uniref:DUF4283 domain protein n=1 Tax=Medicago truncatula TaxID=3880 RepID=A0A072TQD8_MEDTR|nr:DUF4283 domain protein [Medicago truncatula]
MIMRALGLLASFKGTKAFLRGLKVLLEVFQVLRNIMTVHLHCNGGEDIWQVFNDAVHFFGMLFDNIHKWSEQDTRYERGAWLRVYGVPIHAWNDDFFRMCVNRVGRFIHLDECTADRARLDYARILILMPQIEIVNSTPEFLIDDRKHFIKLVEEWGCCLGEDAFMTEEVNDDRPETLLQPHNVDGLDEVQGEWELDDLKKEWCEHEGSCFKKTVLEPVAIKKTAATDISVSKFLEPEAPKNSAAADVHVVLKNTTSADVSDVKILEPVGLKNIAAADVSVSKFLEPVTLKNTGAAEVHVALKNTAAADVSVIKILEPVALKNMAAADVSVHEIQLQQKESKLFVVDDVLIKSIWEDAPSGYSYQPSVGASGGLVTVWDSSRIDVWFCMSFEHVMVIKGKVILTAEEFVIINVYAPCDAVSKTTLWKRLLQLIINNNDVCLCVYGDFNFIQGIYEKKGRETMFRQVEADVFNKFIDDSSLIDLPICGRLFTWYRGDGVSISRLDHFLLSEKWCDMWPNYTQVACQRGLSDHVPLILSVDEANWGPRPLCMLKCWSEYSGCEDFVREK